jgi:glycosyltransferase involved in cell wall biosynthesis
MPSRDASPVDTDADESFGVSAVILTIGRSTLGAALDSIRRQALPPREILVVNDSPEQRPCVRAPDLPVREVFTGGGRGIGAGRNIGVQESTSDFIAYLDDDDVWFPHHLLRARAWFQANPTCDLYASRMIIARNTGVQLAAKVVYSGRKPLAEFYYGPFNWASRRRSIPVSTWVVRRAVCGTPMDEALTDRMDIWWLLEQDRRGVRIQQSKEVGGIWFEDPERTLSRYDAETLLDWADRVDSIAPFGGGRFLIGEVGRLYARRGMWREWQSTMDLVGTRRVGRGTRCVRLLERALLRAQQLQGR